MSCNMVRCVLPSFSRLFTFLYCSASLSYLSSFPTRRSSDLTDEADAVFREFLEPTVGIGVMRVAAVDDDVTRFQQGRSEEHTSELQSRGHLVCRLLLEKKNNVTISTRTILHTRTNTMYYDSI